MHQSLDYRYLPDRIEGLGIRKCPKGYVESYSSGLAQHMAWVIAGFNKKLPVALQEICAHIDDKRDHEEAQGEGQQVLKIR